MKKVLFAAYSLDVGGIETALINLLKEICNDYEITLVLEKKEGIFLKELPENINVIEYRKSSSSNVFVRKVQNFIRQMMFKAKYKNKFDYSVCYATYSLPCSFVARVSSKKPILFVHNDYMSFYNNNVKQYKEFFYNLQVFEYQKIIFVSNYDKAVFDIKMHEFANKTMFINNLIDYKKIINKSNEKVDDFKESKESKEITFINIGRHDEKQKKLSRIIAATKKLNRDKYKFRVVFIGAGIDDEKYFKQANGVKNIEFLGVKENPYPYLKKSDCLLMSSQFEGYPVVFVESMILNKPIVTTLVSDANKDIKGKFGIVTENSLDGVYDGMKKFLDEGFEIKKKFDPEKFNKDIINELKKVFS